MTAGTLSAPNACRPVAANTMVAAHAKMSTALLARAPASCSGAI